MGGIVAVDIVFTSHACLYRSQATERTKGEKDAQRDDHGRKLTVMACEVDVCKALFYTVVPLSEICLNTNTCGCLLT